MKPSGRRNWKRFVTENLVGLLVILGVFLFFSSDKGKLIAISESLPFYTTASAQTDHSYKFPDETTQEGEASETDSDMIGIDDITFQTEKDTPQFDHTKTITEITDDVLEKMEDVGFLKQNFYLVDSRTALLEGDIRPKEFLSADLSIDNTRKGPKVLIFHTHSTEGFADSDMSKDMAEGIWGAGERLKEILEKQYGIETLHDTGRYDIVDGKGHILGAYERMEPSITKILKENPSIQVVIDMHRDGLPDNVHLVTEVNGKKCARIMFFNGLCRLNKDGSPQPTAGLSNPYLEDNLAFSLQMQTTANQLYPDFTRRIYLNAYRYSLHMCPRSLLIEVGSQTNTKEEIWNAMEPLADVLAKVIQ